MPLPRICWSPESRPKVCETEALEVRESIFRATHYPIPITKSATLEGGGTRFSEEELLKEVLAPNRKHLFCVVQGAPGSGKSHLIHWLFRSVRRKKALDLPLHVIEIPRRCSTLADVVREIIKGFDDQSEELRRISSKITAGILQPNVEGAKVQVLDELARVLDFNLWQQNPLENELNPEEKEIAASLPPFLSDSSVRKFLQTRAGKLESMAKRLVGVGVSVDDLEQGDWSPHDLKMDARSVAGISSPNARELATQLQADDDIRRLVARVLNKSLRVAAPNLVGLKYGDLKLALLKIREILDKQGKQLLLLIEDLSVSQGLDMELIESLIIKKGDNEDKKICTIRSVVGVTPEDAVRIRDNIQDRADFFVHFDASLAGHSSAPPALTPQDLLSFTARYLNTTRFKLEELDKWDQASNSPEHQLESACARCPDRKHCFEAFGDFNGHGLYPLNGASVARLYQHVTKDPQLPFNPRKLVRSVLNQFLEQAERALKENCFPSAALTDIFGLASVTPQAQVELRKQNPLKFDQARTAAEVFSENPATGVIPPLIAKALLLNSTTSAATTSTQSTQPETKPLPPKPAESETTKWLNKGEIAEDTVNKWRAAIKGAIENWHDWSADEYAWAFETFEQRNIHFEGQKLHKKGSLELEIKRTPENALAIDILLERKFDTLESIQQLSTFIDKQVQEVRGQLASALPPKDDRKSIETAVRCLSIAVLMQGHDLTAMSLPEQGNSLLTPMPASEAPIRKIGNWQELRCMPEWGECRRWLLTRITRTKGTGEVVLLDIGLCVAHLEAASKHLPKWELMETDTSELPVEVASLSKKLMANFERIYASHSSKIQETSQVITDQLGNANTSEVKSSLRELISSLRDAAALADDRRELSSWYPQEADALAGPALAEQLGICRALAGMKVGNPSAVATIGKINVDLLLAKASALSKAQHVLKASSDYIDGKLKQEGVPDMEVLEKELLKLRSDLLDTLKTIEKGVF